MALDSRDAAFVAYVHSDRAALRATAYLLSGDLDRAGHHVDAVLADAYRNWPRLADPRLTCFSAVLSGALPRGTVFSGALPRGAGWPGTAGFFELIDAGPQQPSDSIVTDLATVLEERERQVVILAELVGLEPAVVAGLTGLAVDQVDAVHTAAVRKLTARDPRRAESGALAAELAAAAVAVASPPGESDDLTRGRQLVRRQRIGYALLAVVVAVVLAVGGGQLFGGRKSTEPAGIAPAGSPPSSVAAAPACDPSDSGCRGRLTRLWRARVSAVAMSYVDPDRRYFTGYSYGYDSSYDSDGLWMGRGGALGLELFTLQKGATEVFVQVATADSFAPRCGQLTGQRCVSMRFMDGNRFTMTETTRVAEGIEVQYSPQGTFVITAVARNTSGGAEMDVTRADLVTLVQDPRLRLPAI
ncbi:MAG TPA: hypothetical protein VFP89_13210 [Propionibacteriaceae bacterium]|nr:hypothetical protein [Propionibacteriaceae bacterium]